MNNEIINKVSTSGLITIDISSFMCSEEKIELDIKKWLWKDSVIKEKEFRAHLKNHNWSDYSQKYVAVFCSEDVIIPVWTYMLIATHLEPYAKHIAIGKIEQLETELFQKALSQIDEMEFKDKRVLIKGCSETYIPISAYVMITNKLLPVVKSLMFGEACSNVPLYKKSS